MKELNFINESGLFERARIIDKAYEKALKNLPDKEREICDGFVELYGVENVTKDRRLVESLKSKFKNSLSLANDNEKEKYKLAVILESIFYEHSEMSEWLGENAITILTSYYDDYVNKVDFLIEYLLETSNAHLGLAVDVTFSADITNKIEKIKEEIKKGVLTEVKYFKSEESGFEGRLYNLPRVIMSVSPRSILELAELDLELNSKNQEIRKEARKKISNHKIQYQVIEEIIIQLEAFKNYAEQNTPEGKRGAVIRSYDKVLTIVKEIKKHKEENGSIFDEYEFDEAFRRIKTFTESLIVR